MTLILPDVRFHATVPVYNCAMSQRLLRSFICRGGKGCNILGRDNYAFRIRSMPTGLHRQRDGTFMSFVGMIDLFF